MIAFVAPGIFALIASGIISTILTAMIFDERTPSRLSVFLAVGFAVGGIVMILLGGMR